MLNKMKQFKLNKQELFDILKFKADYNNEPINYEEFEFHCSQIQFSDEVFIIKMDGILEAFAERMRRNKKLERLNA